MKYYKLVLDNEIIGAITSNNFIRYSKVAQQFANCDETRGEYVDYNGKIYRSTWMRPIIEHLDYISVIIIEITEEEYNAFAQAIESNEKVYDTIKYQEEESVQEVNPIEEASIEFIRSSKITEMSRACRTTIENGFDTYMHGETKHFSLTMQDQINLINLGIMAETEEQLPYHADGEDVEFYTAAEIKHIISEANDFRIYQTTYYNTLKGYINSLNTIEEISSITYGTPIPDEYKTEVLEEIE